MPRVYVAGRSFYSEERRSIETHSGRQAAAAAARGAH